MGELGYVILGPSNYWGSDWLNGLDSWDVGLTWERTTKTNPTRLPMKKKKLSKATTNNGVNAAKTEDWGIVRIETMKKCIVLTSIHLPWKHEIAVREVSIHPFSYLFHGTKYLAEVNPLPILRACLIDRHFVASTLRKMSILAWKICEKPCGFSLARHAEPSLGKVAEKE